MWKVHLLFFLIANVKIVVSKMDWDVKPNMFKPNFTETGKQFFKDLNSVNIASRASLPGIRREFRCMSTSNRNKFTSALQQMKNTMVGLYTQYDHFQVRHSPTMAPGAHNSPSFFGWHREFLVRMESVMQEYCPECMQPYWDNRLDARLGGDPGQSVYFSRHLMGNAVGLVTTGFAANWPFVGDPTCLGLGRTLYRNLEPRTYLFFKDATVDAMDDVRSFSEISSPWNVTLEDLHGWVHLALGDGSHMKEALCSPLDPLFYQHHAFVDLLFEQARQSIKRNNQLNYPDDPRIASYAAGPNLMPPFLITNEYAVIDDSYTRDIYMYETLPGSKRCIFDSDCCDNQNAEFLWCNVDEQCVSKVQEGGSINSFFPDKACHCAGGTPRNNDGICACD